MSEHIDQDLVEGIAKHAVENATEPCAWEAVDKITQFGIKEQVLRFLKDAVPVMLNHGWTPPGTIELDIMPDLTKWNETINGKSD